MLKETTLAVSGDRTRFLSISSPTLYHCTTALHNDALYRYCLMFEDPSSNLIEFHFRINLCEAVEKKKCFLRFFFFFFFFFFVLHKLNLQSFNSNSAKFGVDAWYDKAVILSFQTAQVSEKRLLLPIDEFSFG